jgi:hypothetical protein
MRALERGCKVFSDTIKKTFMIFLFCHAYAAAFRPAANCVAPKVLEFNKELSSCILSALIKLGLKKKKNAPAWRPGHWGPVRSP